MQQGVIIPPSLGYFVNMLITHIGLWTQEASFFHTFVDSKLN
jgi:hypothetical protein